MANSTPPSDGEDDSAHPGTIRGNRPTVPAGFPSGPSGTSRGDVPTIASGFGPGPSGTSRGAGPDIVSGFGTPPGLGPHLSPGSSLTLNGATYVVERLISTSTGEAEIYLLRHGDQVSVLKLYYPNFKPKDEVLAPLKQLRHDDIINLIDYGYFQGRFFEVMEYAAGGTVEQHLPIRDPQRLRSMIAECVNAFQFCHDRGIVHKDIKPENLYYKGADQTDIAIGDFGISSMLDAGISRHLTSQSLTVGYAAPEMYGIGGKVYVGREVDYYALGVTIVHVWAGRSPFEGLGIHAIANLTTTGAIKVPDDLPKDLQTLVRGLTTIDFTHRWGFEEVQRWLKGEDVPVHVQAAAAAYPPFHFGVREEAVSPEALVVLLKGNPTTGKKLLYSGKVSAWVNLFDRARAGALDTIIEDDYPQDQDAGLQKAIYVLDPDQPYERDTRQCRNAQELATALEDGFSFYGPLLTNPHHAFYLYLEAHGAKQEADTFRSYFQTFSAKKALNATILALSGKTSVAIPGREFTSPEDVLAARGQAAVVDLLKDRESRLSLWMERVASATIRARLEAWRRLKTCDQSTLAYVSEGSDGLPQLEVSCSSLSFLDLSLGAVKSHAFQLRNTGFGQLTGSITTNKGWLRLTESRIDTSRGQQDVRFDIDTTGLPFGTTDRAEIEIRSNVGTENVQVGISIESGAEVIARFRRKAVLGAATSGAVLGTAIYAVSAWVGVEAPSGAAELVGVTLTAWEVAAARGRLQTLFRGGPEWLREVAQTLGDSPWKWGLSAFVIGSIAVTILGATFPLIYSAFCWSLFFSTIAWVVSPWLLRQRQVAADGKTGPTGVFVAGCVVTIAAIVAGGGLGGMRSPGGSAQRSGVQGPQQASGSSANVEKALKPEAPEPFGTVKGQADGAPDEIVDRNDDFLRGWEQDDRRWRATTDVALYPSHPERLGTPVASLGVGVRVRSGDTLSVQSAVTLAGRQSARKGNQTFSVYARLEDGCWSVWENGGLAVLCDPSPQPVSAKEELWFQLRTADGRAGWTRSRDAFISQANLDSELAGEIANRAISLPEKSARIDNFLKRGAQLDGDGGQQGSSPFLEAIRAKDIDLLNVLREKGLDLQTKRVCAAEGVAQVALDPGADSMLKYLFEEGMRLDCLERPPLIAFLGVGIGTETYSVSRAVAVASILMRRGVQPEARDSSGKTAIETLEAESKTAVMRNNVRDLREGLRTLVP
ncbi:MAG: protein kinase [Vicinamibacterales bacterium]